MKAEKKERRPLFVGIEEGSQSTPVGLPDTFHICLRVLKLTLVSPSFFRPGVERGGFQEAQQKHDHHGRPVGVAVPQSIIHDVSSLLPVLSKKE